MNDLLQRLKSEKDRRGSKPRCHWITHGSPTEVAARLTELIAPWGHVTSNDKWMPQGFDQTDEAELHKADRLLSPPVREEIKNWWFAIVRGRQKAPTFDIASTCTVTLNGVKKVGFLLVEAKAHDKELKTEEKGKRLKLNPSKGEKTNHDYIGKAITQANWPFATSTGLTWSLSRDSRYQMSNRFASSWKLLDLGFSVLLVYLGFLNAWEMKDKGEPFINRNKWKERVMAHSRPLFPDEVWDKPWMVNGNAFIPIIQSQEISYDRPPLE